MEDVFGNFVRCLYVEEVPNLLNKIQAICTAPTRRRFASYRTLLQHISLDSFLEKNPNVLRELLDVKNKGNENSSVNLFKEIVSVKY